MEDEKQPETLAEMSKRTGIALQTLERRKLLGWSDEEMTAPPQKRRLSIVLEYQGQQLSLRELSKRTGLSVDCLRERHNMGWSVEKILATPARAYTRRAKTSQS